MGQPMRPWKFTPVQNATTESVCFRRDAMIGGASPDIFVLTCLFFLCCLAKTSSIDASTTEPHTPSDDRSLRRRQWQLETSSVGSVKPRSLLQSSADATNQFAVDCGLSVEVVERLRVEAESGRRWVVGADDLAELNGDLQAVVNCTAEGDVLLLRTENAITLQRPITLPWGLTVGAFGEGFRIEDGVATETSSAVRVRCPANSSSAFTAMGNTTVFANLVFSDCGFEDPESAASIISLGPCRGGELNALVLHHVRFRENRLHRGPAVSISDPFCSALEMVDVHFLNNRCRGTCGADLSIDNTLENVEIDENRVRPDSEGIATFFRAPVRSHIMASNVVFRNNTGNLFYVETGTLRLFRSLISENMADVDGVHSRSSACISLLDATVQINNTYFEQNMGQLGSAIHALNSALRLTNVSLAGNWAVYGGSLFLENSNLQATNLAVNNSVARKNGGGLYLNGSSSILCTDCKFERNRARLGGAVGLDIAASTPMALQFHKSRFLRNRAERSGGLTQQNPQIIECISLGGVYYVAEDRGVDCSVGRSNCSVIAFSDTRFRENKANVSGGAIFVSDPALIRLDCLGEQSPLPFSRGRLDSMKRVTSPRDHCSNWRENAATLSGSDFGAFGVRLRKMIVVDEYGEVERMGSVYELNEHPRGQALPRITLQLEDSIGQRPAVGNQSIRANLAFFPSHASANEEESRLFVNGELIFRAIKASDEVMKFIVVITFSDDRFEPFNISVYSRDCIIGEWTPPESNECVTCGPAAFNFLPVEEALHCQTCPEGGNCNTHVILPENGYWHASYCSSHVRKCLTDRACSFEGRMTDLAVLTKVNQTCTLDDEFRALYWDAQCRTGYEGPLCGACASSYGRTRSSECVECRSSVAEFVVSVIPLMVLLALASITIKSNIVNRQKIAPDDDDVRCSGHTTTEELNNGAILVEMTPRESPGGMSDGLRAGLDSLTAVGEMSGSEPDCELERWVIVEVFKIGVNFLQILSIAVTVIVNWSDSLVTLFRSAEFLGAVTTDAVQRSVDCLVPSNSATPSSVISTLVDMAIPPLAVLCFIVVWTIRSVLQRRHISYVAKRVLLSMLAVNYLTYISITKTAVNLMHCVDVHAGTELNSNETTRFWAKDTSVECYKESHAIVVGLVGWPILLAFSFAFPVLIAYISLTRASQCDREGWLYDIGGFLYRAYSQKYVFWESVIMLRKAALAVIVVYAYNLGGNLQGVMAGLVLTIALYFQIICRPYRPEFDRLNDIEGLSLLVSLITFVSGLFFNDEHTSDEAIVLVSTLLILGNVAFLVLLVFALLYYSALYLRAMLVANNVPHDLDGSVRHVLGVFVVDFLFLRLARRIRELVVHMRRPRE